jgi:asparaginyl-tRNA synthetase
MKKNNGFADNFDLVIPGVGEVVGGSVREERLDHLEKVVPDKNELKWYLELRKYGTMQHAGFGLGFERLLLFITGLSNVRDTMPVPRTHKNLLC